MELINTLGLNVQLFIAQVVNFVILIGLATFFLYRPILRVLDNRRATIKKSMEDSKEIERQKREFDVWRKEQMKSVDAEMGKLLDAGRKQAEVARKEMLEKAQVEADELLKKTKEQLETERKKLTADMQKTVGSVVIKLTEKLLEKEFSAADQTKLLQSVEKSLPQVMR